MKLTREQLNGLGIALNEATLLGAEVDAGRFLCGLTMSVLTLPETGPAPEETRLQILLSPVGRVCASLRHGRWDNPNAPIERFELKELLPKVQSFGGMAVYGWEFLDVEESRFSEWSNRLSLDWQGDNSAVAHNLMLFQENSHPERVLDLRIWFNDIAFRKPSGEEVSLDEVIAGGKRWWDGLYAGDPRTSASGIFPLKSSPPNPAPPDTSRIT